MSTTLEEASLLEAVFNHVVLPPKLPSKNDADNVALAYDLGNRLQRALANFSKDKDQDIWVALATSLNATSVLNQGQLDSHELLEALKAIAGGDYNVWLALFITQQNAALLIHRNPLYVSGALFTIENMLANSGSRDRNIVFEAFQTAAPVKNVLAAKHSLVWEFPHRSVHIPPHVFNDISFLRNLSQFLAQASSESFDQFAAKASKGGKSIAETRDVSDPSLVTGMLMSLLEGLGGAPTAQSVLKKVRDDVVLGKSEIPWRRSPYWLVLRVALRRMLRELFDHKCIGLGRVYYKFILCAMLAELLKDSVDQLHPEMSLQLRSKLCRRMAKLKADSEACSPSLRLLYDSLFASFEADFRKTVKDATEKISQQWDAFKVKIARRVPTLPQRAAEADLRMRLDNSGAFLMFQMTQKSSRPAGLASADLPHLTEGTVLEIGRFAEHYISLHQAAVQISKLVDQPERLCSSLSKDIISFLTNVGDTFNGDPVLMSQHLLKLFELWIGMDEAAISMCPLLRDFHPLFHPDALDVLCLMTRDEMVRLNRVQKYIRHRLVWHKRNCGTIFDNIRKESAFPAQFVSSTEAGNEMLRAATTIDKASEKAKEATLSQLKDLTKKYDNLTQSINDLSCTCTVSQSGKRNSQGCRRCMQWGRRKNLKLNAHEDFLPSSDTSEKKAQRAAIIFELLIPGYLADYRAATWRLYLLGTTMNAPSKNTPKLLLGDMEVLKKFSKGVNTAVTLASRKKSFRQTHYGKLKLPKTPNQVAFPFGAELSYYDTTSGLWADELPKVPWYHHLLSPRLPHGISDPYSKAKEILDTHLHPPSSYEIVASESTCPSDIPANELSAFQRVVSARGRRWLEILKEMAASNFNLSNQATNSFFQCLALQAGPSVLEEGMLREAHWVFLDEAFCERLKKQIEAWMDAMSQNWRQTSRMGTVVICILRLYHIGPQSFVTEAHELLLRVRSITSNWILQLQNEVRSTVEGDTAGKAATFAFWAALLCRQTFWGCSGHDCFETALLKDDPLPFFRASIALQENLLDSLDKLPRHLQSLLAQDMSAVYSMRGIVQRWVEKDIHLLEKAIDETWTNTSGLCKRSYTPWKNLKGKDACWITSETAQTDSMASQRVHYHFLQGHLLIDKKPLGRLPLEIRDDQSIRELFEGQHLLTRPSGLLDYQILNEIEGHQIHVGIRDSRIIVKAIFRGSILLFIPRSVFKGSLGWDLPADLVEDCVHWLDLSTGKLEMRRKPRIWRRKLSNWVLDIRKRRAVRNKKNLAGPGTQTIGTHLVEPNSEIGRTISRIFQDFEDTKRLTIYQPPKGKLSVEMKRLEIRFEVNNSGLLVCPQLRAEVDPQQDIGALYGLCSRITLREISNRKRKSVLIPTGNIAWKKEGIHVAIRISNEGVYARYTVDPVLGRLDCPPEPLLLYLKAAMHALTSFPVPDELTGRTGTEEARHCLLSARSQPWAPLEGLPQRVLSVIKSLSPERILYPPGIKVYQKVHWDQDLTSTIQHEDLAPLVDAIQRRSHELEVFEINRPSQEKDSCTMSESHLQLRGRIRRQVYERICFGSDSSVLSQATCMDRFVPRTDKRMSTRSCHVYQTIRAMLDLDTGVRCFSNITPILEEWNMFQGFKHCSSDIDLVTTLGAGMPQLWGPLVQKLYRNNASETYDCHFAVALTAFDDGVDMRMMEWLVTLFKSTKFLLNIEVPKHPVFTNFHHFEEPCKDVLLSLALPDSPNGYSSGKASDLRRGEALRIASHIVKKWPHPPLSRAKFDLFVRDLGINSLGLKKTWKSLQPELQRLKNNWELSVYLLHIDSVAERAKDEQSVVDQDLDRKVWDLKPAHPKNKNPEKTREVATVQMPLNDLLSRQLAHYVDNKKVDSWPVGCSAEDPSTNAPNQVPGFPTPQTEEQATLQWITKRLLSSPIASKRAYGEDLQASLAALIRCQHSQKALDNRSRTSRMQREIALLDLRRQGENIKNLATLSDKSFAWLSEGQLWPCFSPVAILEQLRKSNQSLPPDIFNMIVEYGILTARLQRHLRVEDAILRRDERWLQDNSDENGHSNWSPFKLPEWLLLEIDGNFLIRPIQVEVARAIISPSSKANSVLQMNMGQGKTSCIMPMAAIILADTKSLCRLVVPRALLFQTAQVMQSRLGGLVGREVCHIPFARRSPTDTKTLGLYKDLHRGTLASRGIMLCLPEHLLSFKLSGLQKLADNEPGKAQVMMNIQAWLEKYSRDVLDESDLTLSPKTQLIYPSGVPTMIDGHPQRWQVIEDILSLVESHVSHLQSRFSDGIQVRRRHQGFPIIHLLRTEVEEYLNALLVDDICHGRLAHLQLKADASLDAKRDVKLVLSSVELFPSTWESAIGSLTDETTGGKILHLVHGLIPQRLLILCLKKSWNVQYGLHPTRAPIAVPFEAKGIPSQTAEYGHPDTALVLTCLSFYHAGLSQSQLVQSLQLISNSEDPSSHYQRLVHSENLPDGLQHWNLLEMDNEAQVTVLWQHLRFNKHVVNHFLNNFAFPKHAKQFGLKFQASAWDIPLLPSNDAKQNMTTGFSGTNDNKKILPRNIRQDDLSSLVQTNAEVLVHLLEPRNQKCFQAIDQRGGHLNETGLLELLRRQDINILIDAGAQILEMENHELAAAWLDVYHEAQGAVYFDKNSRIMVRARFQKSPVPLVASPFAEDLSKCVVYIDEAHTRGTDLKLPAYARGAVTLGISSTKDQIVQAAMRLRQLATTQSVSFVAPPEVHQSVLSLRSVHRPRAASSQPLRSIDVVHWLLEQSCEASNNMMSLHIAQGYDFCKRTDALWKFRKASQTKKGKKKLLSETQQPEGQTLEQLYGVRQQGPSTHLRSFDSGPIRDFASSLRHMETDLFKLQRRAHSSAFDEVEQQREVEFEVHQLREKQNPRRLRPLEFAGLNNAIIRFCEGPETEVDRTSFIQAFELLGSSGLGRKYGIKGASSKLFVSLEFTRTVHGDTSRRIMRPVEWILWRPGMETALIIIPEEAELLLPRLRRMQNPTTFLLTYTVPLTRSLLAVGSLAYYPVPAPVRGLAIPTWLSIQVGIFAGRLYLPFDEYAELRSWLAVDKRVELSETLDDVPNEEPEILSLSCMNNTALLQFIAEWLAYRSRLSDIMHTPMGYLIRNRDLSENHPFFTTNLKSTAMKNNSLGIYKEQGNNTGALGAQDSDDDSEWTDGEEEIDIAAQAKGKGLDLYE
ncbi:very large low complexity protein [Fusarium austroafricanum]|uniref:ubiquitinyl hydrolase 1 n=1 Tax=Fusarium austroafricanum TaxID=2364996 RepID=A0A8H4KGJ7_9HYPO|nr:very large low complexity protein [Fusarium austroafricanum]